MWPTEQTEWFIFMMVAYPSHDLRFVTTIQANGLAFFSLGGYPKQRGPQADEQLPCRQRNGSTSMDGGARLLDLPSFLHG